MMRISRQDSADLGFVLAALMIGAISKEELRAWADYAIARLDEPPAWLFDLSFFDAPAFHAYKIVGFVPDEQEENYDALAGIAVSRGRTIDETRLNPEKALQAMKDAPETVERFSATFPFLEF